ncbi:solute carrier family 17 member 9 isoform X3 [Camponotus floridanus]|uniref:solute carrier family 17 member 9 isoform X3 n=1 Tax=Camponotus floridanus TaxID=104421 RepID=UPI00059E3C51|nr:solute carrier family 17 member 9 isoform X3 [Camponotus floridanus]
MQLQISLGIPSDDRIGSSWPRKEKRKWFLSLLCGTCLIYATRTSIPLLMPIISKKKHWSKPESGIILSSFFWGYTLTQVISGYISDRIGGQKVLWISALGWSVTTFFMPEIIDSFSNDQTSVLLVAVVRMINGAFQGGMSLAWTTLLSYHILPFKERTISTKSSTNYTLPWFKLLSKPPFWSCVIGHACQNNCFFVLLSWMPTYFHDIFPEVKIWVVNVIPWLSMLPCTFLGKIISERIIKAGYSVTLTRKTIQTICFVTEIGSLLFLTKVKSFQSAVLCLALIIGGSGFHNNAIAVNPSDLAPKHSGSVFGLMNTVGAIPGFLGVYFSGYILHVTHSWAVVFSFIAVINALGCVIYILFGSGQAII